MTEEINEYDAVIAVMRETCRTLEHMPCPMCEPIGSDGFYCGRPVGCAAAKERES